MTMQKTLWRAGLPAAAVITLALWIGSGLTSPEFALLGVRQACETSDVDLFTRYVDVPGILSRATEGLLPAKPGTDASQAPQGLGQALAKGIQAELTARATQAVLDGVRNGAFASKPPQSYPWPKRLGLSLLPGLPDGVKGLRREGRQAQADLLVPLAAGQPPADVTLVMARREGGWQVVEVQRVAGLLQALGIGGLGPR